MRRRLLLNLSVFAVFLSVTVTMFAQVTVTKQAQAWKGNPSLYFPGISNDPTLTKAILSDLRSCGWFDLGSNANANYTLDGATSGSNVKISLKGSKSLAFSLVKRQDTRETAHVIVDAILKTLFNIPGICSSKIAFCVEYKTGYKELFVCDFDGTNCKQITRNGMLSVEPEWAPGGREIYYTLSGQGKTDIVEYFVASRRSRRFVQFPGLNAGAAISPNGQYMSMILSKDKQVELYMMGLKSRSLKRLTTSSSVEASPCWSPDGKNICFAAAVYGNPKLYIISANGGSMKKVPTIGVEAVAPDWSGDNIVYSARMGKNYTIGLTDLTGKVAPFSLVNSAGDWDSPSWAPDGRHIICSRTYRGQSSLYIIDSFTKKSRLLLQGNKNNFSMPSWSGIIR